MTDNDSVREAHQYPGFKVLLEGPAGSGKTTSLGTLAEIEGVTPFVFCLETGMDVLQDFNKDGCKVHWSYVQPVTSSFKEQARMARAINMMDRKALMEAKGQPQEHNHFVRFMELQDLPVTCQNCGKEFPSPTQWGTDMVLVYDGLSGINVMAMNNVMKGKVAANQSDWGLAMQRIESLLQHCTLGIRCHFVCISHVTRETDELTGTRIITVDTLGRKLPPSLPRLFTDVVLAVRNKDKFTWSTIDPQADLKGRNLSLASGLPPSFVPLHSKWKERRDATVTTTT